MLLMYFLIHAYMNWPKSNIVFSIPPNLSSHLMVVLVLVTGRVKIVVMLTRGFTAVTTAEALALSCVILSPTIVAPVLLNVMLPYGNKLLLHSMTSPLPRQEHIISSLVHSRVLLSEHCAWPVMGLLILLWTWHERSTVAASERMNKRQRYLGLPHAVIYIVWHSVSANFVQDSQTNEHITP